ncbi:MAG: HNH endonuclease [Chloroflexi bacterium]|nr:HNH endonuclease [Chloroflexota bacterium]
MVELQEFQEIYKDVVDYLVPLQTVYEQALYHILLRKTHLEGLTGVRIGQRTLAKITASPSKIGTFNKGSEIGRVSQSQIKTVIKSLAKKGHIEIGDTTFDGTFYRVRLPRDIPECLARIQDARQQHEDAAQNDFYTVPTNRLQVYERDNYQCRYCGLEVTDKGATLDHVKPVSMGGDNSLENLVTCCLTCNAIKAARSPDESVLALLERYRAVQGRSQKT